MKTVLLTAFQSFISRNILNTGVLDELLFHGYRVVVCVPKAKEAFYKSTYDSKSGVVIEVFDIEKFESRRERIFRDIALLLISTKTMVHRKIKIYESSGRSLRYLYHRCITALFGGLIWPKVLYRSIDYKFNNPDAFRSLLEKYSPEVVFATDVFGMADAFMLKSAKKHKIRSVGMVTSWDNNTSKGLMRMAPDKLIVQNEIIKQESIEVQHVPEQIIVVVGIPHFEYYKSYTSISRREFFSKLGLDTKKRIIVFSPAGDKFISTDWQICEILRRSLVSGGLPDDVVILIRIHPTNPVSFKGFVPDKNFVIDSPGVSFDGLGEKRKELDKSALHHLLDTLNHAELVINVVSSIVIDAAVLDKPIVTVGFDGWEKKVPFGSSVGRYLADDNMAKLLRIGGTRVARDENELISIINMYLSHPETDKELRKTLVEKQCYVLDGLASRRIANCVAGTYK